MLELHNHLLPTDRVRGAKQLVLIPILEGLQGYMAMAEVLPIVITSHFRLEDRPMICEMPFEVHVFSIWMEVAHHEVNNGVALISTIVDALTFALLGNILLGVILLRSILHRRILASFSRWASGPLPRTSLLRRAAQLCQERAQEPTLVLRWIACRYSRPIHELLPEVSPAWCAPLRILDLSDELLGRRVCRQAHVVHDLVEKALQEPRLMFGRVPLTVGFAVAVVVPGTHCKLR
mmetsp:Transcript_49055/g.137322  ORF Transcript_49055/g.137322 Transcript_49055/m.137322 type:complete len:235 (-) Transcript_49055:784-1488(-)